MLKHFTDRHRGLREIRIYVARTTVDDVKVAGSEIQRLLLVSNEDGVPLESPLTLCRLTWLRGERFVRTNGARTQFRIHLIGTDPEGNRFDQQGRFTIDTNQTLEDTDNDDDGDGTDDDQDEDEDQAENDDDNDDDEWDGDDDGWEDDRSVPSPMVPLAERVEPVTGQRQLVPQQLNPAFITHIQHSTLELAHRAYAGPMKENRGLVHEMRLEMTGMIRTLQGMSESLLVEQRRSFELLLTRQLEMASEYSKRDKETIDRLASRVEAMEKMNLSHAELDSKRYENFQELAKQGWQAFLDAMEMKQSIANERLEWAEWIRRGNEQSAPPPPPQPSAVPGLVAQGIPVILGGLSLVLRRKGDNQSADFLANMAMRYAPSQGSVDDDEDVIDIDPDPNDPQENIHQEGTRSHGPSRGTATFADRARVFRSGLSNETVEAIRKVLPSAAWKAFNAACTASTDRVAVDSLKALEGFIRNDPNLQFGLMTILSESQIASILEMIEDVSKMESARPPRRPPPRPSPE